MTIDKRKYSKFLESVAEELDIPPSKYQDAVNRYQAVGHWLELGQYLGCVSEPSIYPQGSFRLGTVVRPIKAGIEADYDIDLVCELGIPKQQTVPRYVKMVVGKRLSDHDRYRKLLEQEGKRCWTLKYAEQDGIGFHLDVLPSISDACSPLDTSIAITNREGSVYDWSASNPKGYGVWFDGKNQEAFSLAVAEQKLRIQSRAPITYKSVEEVPDRLVRTSLQRSIQIMKRHRDMKFQNGVGDYAPISIIITTLAAQLYGGEQDIFSALTGIISRLHAFAELIDGRIDPIHLPSDLITRTQDGKWHISNPVNPEENFADRWHENNHARARAFFSWVKLLQEDFVDILASGDLETVRSRLISALGASVAPNHIDLVALVPVAPFVPISRPARPWGSR